ncbi:hypothetical protein ACLB2K_040034 [Fragaria x ananassa]
MEDPTQILWELRNMVEQLSTLRYVNGRQHLHEFFKEKLEGRTEEQYNLDSLMVTLFGEHVAAKVAPLVALPEDAARKQGLVREVIELHDELKNHIFFNNFSRSRLYRALQDGFRRILVRSKSFAVQLAKFCDSILKKGKFTYEEIQKKMDTVVELIDCLGDKDQFSELYRHQLASRLLCNQSISPRYESTVISKMQHVCGSNFTKKMEVLLKDMEVQPYTSGELMDVTVVSDFDWPRLSKVDITLPEAMERSRKAFEDMYKSEAANSKRRLSWPYSLGTCILNATFDGRDIELIASVPQAALLMLFNDADKLSRSEIKARLGITDDVFASLVNSLSSSKCKLIDMEQSGDLVVFNSEFSVKKNKLQLPSHKLIDKKKVIKTVDMQRTDMIDAALVRIAKSKKVIGKTELIKECLEELERFQPSIEVIETRIKYLVRRKFLKTEVASEVTCYYMP